MELIPEKFTPAEAHAMTGVTPQRQREWRMYGWLVTEGLTREETKGWKRWHEQDLALLMIFGRLQSRYGAVSLIKQLATSDGAMLSAELVWVYALIATGGDVGDWQRNQVDDLEDLPRFMIADGENAFEPVTPSWFLKISAITGVATLIDLKDLGEQLARVAPRPLARLESEDN